MTNNFKSKWPLIIGVTIMLIYCGIYWLKGGDSYMNPIDNLDSNVVWAKVINEQGAHFWSNEALVEGMVGIQPRHVYGSEFDPLIWISYFLGPLWGWIVVFTIVHLIAFSGMYLVLKNFLQRNSSLKNEVSIYAVIGGLLFGLIPFWIHAGLSSAGIPLIFLSVIFIDEGKLGPALLLTTLYTLFSSLIFAGLFVGFLYLFGLIVYRKALISKGQTKHHLINFFTMVVIYLIVNYRLFDSILFSNFVSHRTDFITGQSGLNINAFIGFVFFGQWHAGTIFPLLSILSLVGLLYVLFKRDYFSKDVIKTSRLHIAVLLLVLVFSNGYVNRFISEIPILGSLQLDRFYVLIPFTTCMLFMVLLPYLGRLKKLRIVGMLIVSVILAFNLINDTNWNGSIRSALGMKVPSISFNEFYSRSLFSEIREYLDDNDYSRVVSLGFHPAVSVYNKIRSADGYLASYSLESKKAMASIIGEEIEKDQSLKAYFNNWGSRCYFYNADIGRDFTKLNKTKSFNGLYDYSAMKKHGIDFILSAVKIKSTTLSLSEIIKSSDDQIFIYEIANDSGT
ncbi:DUF6044 family protein [Roseivirga sp.]|uniref:DUF6044 family protein n=1 Tax=Roseivirga sp. TaxID=1964215 RepID=UPI003B8C0586